MPAQASLARTVRVAVLRWPADASRRTALARGGRPRLLVVPAGTPAPIVVDDLEDWVRVPCRDHDLSLRIERLDALARMLGA